MKTISMTYGQVLFDLHIQEKNIEDAEAIIIENPEVRRALESPVVAKNEKEAVIDSLFAAELGNFFKIACANRDIDCLLEAFEFYRKLKRRYSNTIRAEFYYVTKPNQEQIERIKEYLRKKYQAEQTELILTEDPLLIGGFVLKVGDNVFDNSLKGKMTKLQQSLTWR